MAKRVVVLPEEVGPAAKIKPVFFCITFFIFSSSENDSPNSLRSKDFISPPKIRRETVSP